MSEGFEKGPAPLSIPTGTVLFLGDSITHAGLFQAYLETCLRLFRPARTVDFLNCGLPSETVSGLSEVGHAGGKFPRPDLTERLARVLDLINPDFVIACYGMNDGIFQPWDANRFQSFQIGMERLHETVVAAGAAILHVTPPIYEDVNGEYPYYSEVVAKEAGWLLEQKGRGWRVADVFGPMAVMSRQRQKKEPGFHFSEDGVHPGPLGHWVMAQAILRALGLPEVSAIPDVEALTATHPNGAAILEHVIQRTETLRDAWLSASGHLRPGLPAGLALPEAREKARALEMRITDLLAPHVPPVSTGSEAGRAVEEPM